MLGLLSGLALAAQSPHSAVARPLPPIAATDSGLVRGERTRDGRSLFRGIPFAAPPRGALRWEPPAPVGYWAGVRDATRSGPTCPQSDYGWNHAAWLRQSEDCLYLEVATPSLRPHKPWPVMVWIHGGGNRGGSGARVIEAPIVRRGIVLVSIQYRLGPLGFLSHPALGSISGNYGLMDQQAALRWVRRNIRAFGGDPDNVTLFGQSAGGQDVGLQMLSPGARGLFHKAIEESGAPGFGMAARSLVENEAIGRAILTRAGAPAHADGARLRRLPVTAILRAADSYEAPDISDNSFIWLQAVIDGAVLRASPAEILDRGEQARIPLIIGTNMREIPLHGGEGKAQRAVDQAFGAAAQAAAALYGLGGRMATDPRMGDISHQIATDIFFRCPALLVAQRWVEAGSPVWSYVFDVAGPGARPVSHSAEIRYVLGNASAQDRIAPLAAYWAQFARSGDPNRAGLPAWPGFAPQRTTIRFAPDGAELLRNWRDGICRLRSSP